MIKYLFVYGVLLDNLNSYSCKTDQATAYGMKLTVHKINKIPAIIPTYDLHDYVNGQAVKVCNQNTMHDMLKLCDQIAYEFTKKIIQIMVNGKKKEAYAYFPKELSLYDEINCHSYAEYKQC